MHRVRERETSFILRPAISSALHDADMAMYRAKAKGTGHFEIFARAGHGPAAGKLMIDSALR